MANAEKIGRNDPCPCGSNRKFKKCCGKEAPSPINQKNFLPAATFQWDEETIWTIGSLRIVPTKNFIDEFLRDISMDQKSVLGLIDAVWAEMEKVAWTHPHPSHVLLDYSDPNAEPILINRPVQGHPGKTHTESFDTTLGFYDQMKPLVLSPGFELRQLVMLYPRNVRRVKSHFGSGPALHSMCHEFAHAFGACDRLISSFDEKTRAYWDHLADYFSLRAKSRLNGLPDFSRYSFYLGAKFEVVHGRKGSDDVEILFIR